MPIVEVPKILAKYTNGATKIKAEGKTVKRIFDHCLKKQFPELYKNLFDEKGNLWISIFVNGEYAKYSDEKKEIKENDIVTISIPIAGGIPGIPPLPDDPAPLPYRKSCCIDKKEECIDKKEEIAIESWLMFLFGFILGMVLVIILNAVL